MSDHERGPQGRGFRDQEGHGHGAYEPAADVQAYDVIEDEGDEEGSRLPLLIVLALVVLAMFAGVVYLAYTQGVARGRGETPVLAAADGPARVAPGQPGGTKVPYQGFKIYEQPAPPDDQVGDTTARTTDQGDAADAAQATPAKPASAQPAARPAPSPAKAAAQTRRPASRTTAGQATAAPRALAQATPAKSAPAPKSATTSVASSVGGAYFLQVGAFKSQADAEAAWKTYKARHATLLAGHGLDVQRVDLGPKGIWYRARVGGFSNRDVALALCDRLKADGGACFLAH